MPTESLLTLSPIALTSQNELYLAAGVLGSLLTLSIIIGAFLAIYTPKEDDN